jgi:hypothetical protein
MSLLPSLPKEENAPIMADDEFLKANFEQFFKEDCIGYNQESAWVIWCAAITAFHKTHNMTAIKLFSKLYEKDILV